MARGMFVLLVATLLPASAVAQPHMVRTAPSAAALDHTVSYFEQATARDPRDQEAWLNLAMAYRKLGRETEAATAFHRVLDLDNVVLQDRVGDDVWSHTLARKAIATPVALASR